MGKRHGDLGSKEQTKHWCVCACIHRPALGVSQVRAQAQLQEKHD